MALLRQPFPLRLPAGFQANNTKYSRRGAWVDGHLVRWHENTLSPIGGWRRINSTPLSNRIANLKPVTDNSGHEYMGVGTSKGLYVLSDGELNNVTPDGFSGGRDQAKRGYGYGIGKYGDAQYGRGRAEGANMGKILGAANWSMTTWGDYLVAVSDSDQTPYYWRPRGDQPGSTPGKPDSKAAAVPNAPTARAVLTTQEYHLMLVGGDENPRRISWSGRQDFSTWTAEATNLAGYIEVPSDGVLITARQVGSDILLLSTTEAFRVSYIGATLVYGQTRVGSGCGLLAPGAVAVANDIAVWMGRDGFYTYRGSVAPLQCPVLDWVYRQLDRDQISLIQAGVNSEYSEVYWFFPCLDDEDEGDNESIPKRRNTRYVVWNYRENIWYFGYLPRDTWSDKGSWERSVAAKDGYIYEHEIPLVNSAAAHDDRDMPWIESAPFDINDGQNLYAVMGIVPDSDSVSLDALEFRFYGQLNPRRKQAEFGPYRPDSTGYTDTRFQDRQIAWRVDVVNDVDWRLGVVRMDIRGTSGR